MSQCTEVDPASRIQTREAFTDYVAKVSKGQTEPNAIATAIVSEAGLCPSEVVTIAPIGYREVSKETVVEGRFRGLGEPNYLISNGKQTREIYLSPETAARLETYRIPDAPPESSTPMPASMLKRLGKHPVSTHQRPPTSKRCYDIAAGSSWSSSFSSAANRITGYTTRPKALRSAFVRIRLVEYRAMGCQEEEAQRAVAAELALPDLSDFDLSGAQDRPGK